MNLNLALLSMLIISVFVLLLGPKVATWSAHSSTSLHRTDRLLIAHRCLRGACVARVLHDAVHPPPL